MLAADRLPSSLTPWRLCATRFMKLKFIAPFRRRKPSGFRAVSRLIAIENSSFRTISRRLRRTLVGRFKIGRECRPRVHLRDPPRRRSLVVIDNFAFPRTVFNCVLFRWAPRCFCAPSATDQKTRGPPNGRDPPRCRNRLCKFARNDNRRTGCGPNRFTELSWRSVASCAARQGAVGNRYRQIDICFSISSWKRAFPLARD